MSRLNLLNQSLQKAKKHPFIPQNTGELALVFAYGNGGYIIHFYRKDRVAVSLHWLQYWRTLELVQAEALRCHA